MILIIPLLFLLLTNANSAVGIPIEDEYSNAQNTSFWIYCWSDSVDDYTKVIKYSDYDSALSELKFLNEMSEEADCYIREEE